MEGLPADPLPVPAAGAPRPSPFEVDSEEQATPAGLNTNKSKPGAHRHIRWNIPCPLGTI